MGDNEDEILAVNDMFDDSEGDTDDDEVLTRGALFINPPLRLGNESRESDELNSDGDGIRGHDPSVVTVEDIELPSEEKFVCIPELGDLFV